MCAKDAHRSLGRQISGSEPLLYYVIVEAFQVVPYPHSISGCRRKNYAVIALDFNVIKVNIGRWPVALIQYMPVDRTAFVILILWPHRFTERNPLL